VGAIARDLPVSRPAVSQYLKVLKDAGLVTDRRLEHRHFDRHGEGWENMRDAVGSSGGWGTGLRAFADAAMAD
jgi:DNA-binding transcriptional ArsR family regulator